MSENLRLLRAPVILGILAILIGVVIVVSPQASRNHGAQLQICIGTGLSLVGIILSIRAFWKFRKEKWPKGFPTIVAVFLLNIAAYLFLNVACPWIVPGCF
jgi:uncharacterized membrane protein HdeD (DUF308 family)